MRKIALLLSFLVGFSTLLTPSLLFAQTPTEAPAKRKIVVFNANTTYETRDHIIHRFQSTSDVEDLPVIHANAVTISDQESSLLKKQPGVVRVEDDALISTQVHRTRPLRTRKTSSQPTASTQSLPRGVDRIDADAAWQYANGHTVKVGVIDTGVDITHPDLIGNIKPGINIVQPSRQPIDDNGHGTHVSGIIAAENNAIGVVGVAPQVELYPIKAIQASGLGYISDIIKGIDWAIDKHLDVVNISLGTTSDIQSLHDAVKRARQAGIVVVAAAGNTNGGAVTYPAKYSEVIAVAATNVNDQAAAFSAKGSEVDLAAPGESILSTYRNGRYESYSGTSMAAPHVTGTVALLLNQPSRCDSNGDGHCSPDEVQNRLTSRAEDLGPGGYDTSFGAGLVDAERVVAP